MAFLSKDKDNKENAREETFFQKASAFIQHLFFATERKQKRSKTKPASSDGKRLSFLSAYTSQLIRFENILLLVLIFVLLFGFVQLGHWFANTSTIVASKPMVRVLSVSDFKTMMTVSEQDPCLRGQNRGQIQDDPCWKDTNFDEKNWIQINIPKEYNFREKLTPTASKDFEGIVYYRFHIPIHRALLESTEEISFTPMYINHDWYDVFVNGNLVLKSQSEKGVTDLLMIPIMREHLNPDQPDQIIVAVKASLKPDEKGITGYMDAMIGPARHLYELRVMPERANLSFYLLFLVSKASILVVFILFYFFSLEKTSLRYFLLYAFCVTAESLIQGEFLNKQLTLTNRLIFFFELKAVSFAAIFAFFVSYYQALRAMKWTHILLATYLSVINIAIAYVTFAQEPIITWHTIRISINYSFAFFLLLGVILGVFAIDIWKRSGVPPHKLSSLKIFVGVVGIYFVLCVWEFGFNTFLGFDQRAFFDMLFFFYIAFVTAREFGFNAGQVLSLEAHMVEKRRMQAELEEAAEIAKAFLPGEPPAWNFCEIGVYHKPITESSGDWYTFESSPSGNFAHFFMCDITGHGVQAALVVSTARTVLSALKSEDPQCTDRKTFTVDYAKALNNILYSQGKGQHVSSFMGISFDIKNSKIYYLACAHPYPLMIQANADGTKVLKALPSRAGVLGVHQEVALDLKEQNYRPGDEIIAFTDGIPLTHHMKVLKKFIEKPRYKIEEASRVIYNQVWAVEEERSEKTPDDDISIVWFRLSA